MAKAPELELLVVTNRTGYIPQLQMCGPIVSPLRIPASLCLSMVTAGVKLYAIDTTTNRNVELTIHNIFDENKFYNEEAPKSATADTYIEAPVVEAVEVTPTAVVEEAPVAPVEAEVVPEPVPEVVVEAPVVEVAPEAVAPVEAPAAPKAPNNSKKRHN